MPRDNRPYWRKKVTGNRRRDHRRSRELRTLGWRVLRVWEHDLESPRDRARILTKVSALLKVQRERVK